MDRGSLIRAGVAFLHWLALASLLLTSSFAAQGPSGSPPSSTEKKDECSIVDMVVKLAGSEPLGKVRVHLQSMEDRTRAVSTVTNAEGRFELRGIDPGRYRLTVSRVGFVTQEYGQKKPDDPPTVFSKDGAPPPCFEIAKIFRFDPCLFASSAWLSFFAFRSIFSCRPNSFTWSALFRARG